MINVYVLKYPGGTEEHEFVLREDHEPYERLAAAARDCIKASTVDQTGYYVDSMSFEILMDIMIEIDKLEDKCNS